MLYDPVYGIGQFEADAAAYGQQRYSLWTGDSGFAIYLWDCVLGTAMFPTLDVFFAAAGLQGNGRDGAVRGEPR
jgi:hypothetical protein